MSEGNNILWLSVLEHGERCLIEVSYDVQLVVYDRGVQQNLVDILAKNEDAVIARWFLLIFLCGWGGCGSLSSGRF